MSEQQVDVRTVDHAARDPLAHGLRADAGTFAYVEGLYETYRSELITLTKELARRCATGAFEGSRGTYDIEGELYYMAVRELRPRRVLEMASAAGWSTLYLASAVAANGGDAAVHTFELLPENVARVQRNVIQEFPFVTMHPGDCRERFRALVAQDPAPFELILLDVHATDFPQFAVREIFPRTRGLAFIHDVLPNNYPWNHPEGVFYLWLLQQGGVPFLPIATLVARPEIARVREALTARHTDGVRGTFAKGIMLAVNGPDFDTPAWRQATGLRFAQFPAKGLDQYPNLPGRLAGVSLRELLRAAARICRDRVLGRRGR